LIEVQDVTKSYGAYQALKGVSFSVKNGEILGFLGPNGAGKTTLMRILTCFLPASAGSARVAGYDCETQPMEVRRRIGYLPESVPLYTDMRVREYLHFAADAKGLGRAEREVSASRAMAETGTDVVAGKLIRQLSKGFRQRVGLAQALIGDPEVLILDEPTVGLDPRQISDIRTLIKSLAGKRTVILSTHILPEVSAVCSRVVIINKGRVIESDTTANLARKLSTSSKVLVQVDGPEDSVIKVLRDLDKVRKVSLKEAVSGDLKTYVVETAKETDLRPALAAAVAKKGWGLHELRFVGMELEDIFLQLVTQEGEGAKTEEAA
jgi:ABC-2 type transport system ATP-binding protein